MYDITAGNNQTRNFNPFTIEVGEMTHPSQFYHSTSRKANIKQMLDLLMLCSMLPHYHYPDSMHQANDSKKTTRDTATVAHIVS